MSRHLVRSPGDIVAACIVLFALFSVASAYVGIDDPKSLFAGLLAALIWLALSAGLGVAAWWHR